MVLIFFYKICKQSNLSQILGSMTPVRLNPDIHPSWNVENLLCDQLVNTTTKAEDFIEQGKLKDLEVRRSRNITLIKNIGNIFRFTTL